MGLGVSPSVGLLSIILFLLPGLAGVKLALQIAERGDWLNRIDTITLSFGVSLFSMVTIYFGFSLLKTVLDSGNHFLTVTEVQTRLSSIPSAIFHYVVLVGFALLVGSILGYFDFGRNRFTSNLLWRRFFDIVKDSGDGENYAVRIRTRTGDELFGRVEDEGETALSRDIILENPRRVRYDENGEVAEEHIWTGYAYVHNQSVSHVEFDRLEDADESEAREAEMDEQRTIDDSYEDTSDPEIERLKRLAEGESEGDEDAPD